MARRRQPAPTSEPRPLEERLQHHLDAVLGAMRHDDYETDAEFERVATERLLIRLRSLDTEALAHYARQGAEAALNEQAAARPPRP